MKKKAVTPPDLQHYRGAAKGKQNRLLLDWLDDDAHRATLFRLINHDGGKLTFPSRDAWERPCDCDGPQHPGPLPQVGHRDVEIVTDRNRITEILKDDGSRYSNRLYAELGGGSFMLALDPKRAVAHPAQRAAFLASFPHDTNLLADLSHRACRAAAVSALRAADFDLAVYAEQAAVRYCQKLMGYGLANYTLLESSLRTAYQALVYQVLGRHFVTDPLAVQQSKLAMGQLLKRTSALIDAYGRADEDVIKRCRDTDLPAGFNKPVLQKLGEMDDDLNGEQRAVIAVGAAVGTVGNVQAAACIAVQALFASQPSRPVAVASAGDSLWTRARRLALKVPPADALDSLQLNEWKTLIQGLLQKNPPIPFLPRLELDSRGLAANPGKELLLALGGATLGKDDVDDPLVWGLATGGTHWCAGQALAWPLICEIVRQVMALPNLEERLDAEDASVIGLKKRWGFACESYPLTHRRDRLVMQSSLNVAMRVKSPVKDNADRVREVIQSGAPRIEQALRESRHVHFAWFELVESDTVLVLHTVYDGPFEAYLQDFALKVGVLFDLLFECIEDPPPMPVDLFPTEFVAHLQRYDRRPAMGYFFSAYPKSSVAAILRDEWARP